jgi:hypothetical protein
MAVGEQVFRLLKSLPNPLDYPEEYILDREAFKLALKKHSETGRVSIAVTKRDGGAFTAVAPFIFDKTALECFAIGGTRPALIRVAFDEIAYISITPTVPLPDLLHRARDP